MDADNSDQKRSRLPISYFLIRSICVYLRQKHFLKKPLLNRFYIFGDGFRFFVLFETEQARVKFK